MIYMDEKELPLWKLAMNMQMGRPNKSIERFITANVQKIPEVQQPRRRYKVFIELRTLWSHK